MEGSRNALIRRYFNEGLHYADILTIMSESHDISLSLRHLHRILRSLNLRRRVYSDIPRVVDFILNEIGTSGRCHGYRMMRQRCMANGLQVRTQDVATILRVCDPVGVKLRTARRFVRRSYFAAGPNFIWHIDGYDKIKPFGLCIHGCICGFSRKVIWLNVYTTNNNPRVIGGYFLETVRHYGGTPRMIRGDFGTENVLVKRMQSRFRNEESSAYIDGASTQNQRIECWWGQLRRQHMQYYMDLFKDLRDRNEFSGSELDKNLMQFCFMAVIQDELDLAMTVWNNHSIRRSRNAISPNGKPNIMFQFPGLWNTRNYMCAVSQNDIDAFHDEVDFRSLVCCDPDVYEMCIGIMAEDNIVPPNCANEAVTFLFTGFSPGCLR